MLAIEFKGEYIADIVVLLAIMVWAVVDARKGFINCFFSFVSAIVCVLAILFLSKPILIWTGGLFGAEAWLQDGLGGWLSGIKPFNLDVSMEGWQAAFEEMSLPQFLKDAVLAEIEGVVGEIPAGTLLGQYVGNAIGTFLATALCAIVVFILVKLIMLLLRGVLNKVAESSVFIEKINLLGGLLAGAFKAFALVCVVLAVLSLFASEGITSFFDKTLCLKGLYHSNPLFVFFSWFKA
ncbi:MAG: CvpA family protein [Clostridia bacterium]|nr:CvpA family protein [Clostridia bacterium]